MKPTTRLLPAAPAILFLLLVSACVPTAAEPSWHLEVKREGWPQSAPATPKAQAFAFLINTERFYPTPDITGWTPRQSIAFAIILDQPDAAAAFADLVDRGTSCGQLYGLCGLYLTDRAELAKRLPAFAKRTDPIEMPFPGCFGDGRPMKDVISLNDGYDIAHGKYPEILKAMADSLKP